MQESELYPVNEGTHPRQPNDARQHGLACCQRPFSICAAGTVAIRFRLCVAVETLVLVDGTADASTLLSLSGVATSSWESGTLDLPPACYTHLPDVGGRKLL
jgi:hypothetical protein